MPRIVDDGAARAVIVLPPDADEVERFAGRELARYLHLASGAAVPVLLGEPETLHGTPIYLGASERLGGTDAENTAAPAGPDGYVIRATENLVEILGGESRGALYGVYRFCEEFLGIGFPAHSPDGDEVPVRTTVDVPECEVRRAPAFAYRSFIVFGAENDAPEDGNAVSPLHADRIDWLAKQGASSLLIHSSRFSPEDVERHLAPAAHTRGVGIEWSHHNLGFWLPSRTFGRTHPEYYAVRNALRADDAASQLCVCTSNPAVADEIARAILRFHAERPWARDIGLWPNDGYGMCECDSCARLDRYNDDENRQHAYFRGTNDPVPNTTFDRNKTNRYVRFLNDVVERVVAEQPDARLSALFYVDMMRPAPDIPLHPAIDPIVALYWRCSSHALFDPGCPTNNYFATVVDEWTNRAPGRVSFYEYYMGMDEYCSLPFPILRTLAADWPEYAARGVRGATIQSAASHHTAYGLNYAAFAALAWEPSLDVPAFANEWFARAFGPAASEASRWWGALDERMAEIAAGTGRPTSDPRRPRCYTPTRRNFPALWDQDRMARLGLALDRAAENADLSHGQRHRLNQLRAYHTYCVASADAFGRELTLREARAAKRHDGGSAEETLEAFDRLEAFVRQIDDPTIVFTRRVLRRLGSIRAGIQR